MASRSLSRTVGKSLLVRSYGTVQNTIPKGPTQATSSSSTALQNAVAAEAPRTSWTRDEIQQIYETPLHQLTYAAVRRPFFRMMT